MLAFTSTHDSFLPCRQRYNSYDFKVQSAEAIVFEVFITVKIRECFVIGRLQSLCKSFQSVLIDFLGSHSGFLNIHNRLRILYIIFLVGCLPFVNSFSGHVSKFW